MAILPKKAKSKYANEATLDAVLEIMYNALKEKANVSQLKVLEETITELQQSSVSNALTVDDVLKTLEGYDEEADGNKVIAASLFKEIVEKLENGEFGGKIEDGTYVKVEDVLTDWDAYDEEVLQVVSATLIKAISDSVTELKTTVDNLEKIVGDGEDLVKLGEDGKIPSDVLPSYVDDVVDVYLVEEENEETGVVSRKIYEDAEHENEIIPEGGKIYNDISSEDGVSWRWSGSKLIKVASDDLVPITREEVRAKWDAIVVPEEDDEEDSETESE